MVTHKSWWDSKYLDERWVKKGLPGYKRTATITKTLKNETTLKVTITGDYKDALTVSAENATTFTSSDEDKIEVGYKYEFYGRQYQNSIQRKQWKVVTREGEFCTKPKCATGEKEVWGSRKTPSGHIHYSGQLIGWQTVDCIQPSTIKDFGKKTTHWLNDKKRGGIILRDGVEVAGNVKIGDFHRHANAIFREQLEIFQEDSDEVLL